MFNGIRWGVALALCLLTACGGDRPQVNTAEGAMVAAQLYYECLAIGQYEAFLNGRYGAADMPADYRQQLIEAYQQFMAQQREQHGSVVSIEATEALFDSTQHPVSPVVLLTIAFADSIREEIAVPMILEGDQWLMR